MLRHTVSLVPLAVLFVVGGQAGAQSDDLSAICRANELAVPDSCPCTVERAREAGIGEGDLRSLVTDDGHTDPVDQQTYGRFWMVKSQCIADATMAGLGLPSNLPGMPGQPGMSMPPAPPPPLAQPAPPPASPPSRAQPATTPPAVAAAPARTAEPGRVSLAVDDPLVAFRIDYDERIDAWPALVEHIRRDRDEQLADTKRRLRDLGEKPSYVDAYEADGGWSLRGAAGSLVSLDYGAYENWSGRGNSGGTRALLWDADAGQPTSWDSVFAGGLELHARLNYCGALDRERIARGVSAQDQGCPAFEELVITLDTSGATPVMVFYADPYVAGSYAEGPYEVRLPLAGDLAAQVRQPYRAALGLGAEGPGPLDPALGQRLARLTIGAPNWSGFDCGGVVYRLPADPGPLYTFDDARAAQARGEPVFASGGELGLDNSFRAGLMLDGRFLAMEGDSFTGFIAPAAGEIFTAGNVTFEYTYANKSYEPALGWGKGQATLTVDGVAAQFPIVFEGSC